MVVAGEGREGGGFFSIISFPLTLLYLLSYSGSGSAENAQCMCGV